ncbi:hypothetical protein [Streptomyces boninensis]|uniref:hypothetical protein n=1 Tax=Streptomyces boninensis TaxID=2039455 RepID=UPI003B217BB7
MRPARITTPAAAVLAAALVAAVAPASPAGAASAAAPASSAASARAAAPASSAASARAAAPASSAASTRAAAPLPGAPGADPAPAGPQRPYEPDVAGPDNADALTARVTPAAGGHDRVTPTPGGQRGVRVEFDRTSRTADGGKPAAARRFVFLFDRSVTLHPADFPVCDRATLEADGPGGCPQGSQVGEGTAEFHPHGSAEVLAFNTRYRDGTWGVLVAIPATGTILEQTLERASAPYRARGYRWTLDEILPPTAVPPQERSATLRFRLAFGTVRDGASYATTTAPAGKALKFGLWSEFVTGQVLLPEASAGQRSGRRANS